MKLYEVKIKKKKLKKTKNKNNNNNNNNNKREKYGGSCQLTVSDRTSEYNKTSPTATYGTVHIRKNQNRETQKIVEY